MRKRGIIETEKIRNTYKELIPENRKKNRCERESENFRQGTTEPSIRNNKRKWQDGNILLDIHNKEMAGKYQTETSYGSYGRVTGDIMYKQQNYVSAVLNMKKKR